jgi:hypothetical protein
MFASLPKAEEIGRNGLEVGDGWLQENAWD